MSKEDQDVMSQCNRLAEEQYRKELAERAEKFKRFFLCDKGDVRQIVTKSSAT